MGEGRSSPQRAPRSPHTAPRPRVRAEGPRRGLLSPSSNYQVPTTQQGTSNPNRTPQRPTNSPFRQTPLSGGGGKKKRKTDGNDGSLSSGLKPSISPLSPVQSTAALVRSQHFSGVADEFAEKTRSTGMTLTIGLARSIGLAIVRLGVAASLRALLVACRAGRASESIARSSRCTWPEMARDGVRWGEMARDCGGPHGGAWAWCRHAMAWDGACVHLPRDG